MRSPLLYIHHHAADRLRALGHTKHIIAFIEHLKKFPSTTGDYRQPDPQGRIIEVKILGRHGILYFTDPFANLIKILEIKNIEG